MSTQRAVKALAAEGLSCREASDRLGISPGAVRAAAARFGVRLTAKPPVLPVSPFKADLTEAQRQDVDLLMRKGKYSLEEAVTMILRPRRKVRAPTLADLGATR